MPARAGLDREAVVRAAAALLDEKAGHEVTLAELAAKLGVRTPSLYNHVDGIEDLQGEVALYGTRELGQRIARAAIGKSGRQAVIAIAGAYRSFAKERPGLYLATLRAPSGNEGERAQVSDEILDILRIVLEPFGMSPDTEIHAIRSMRSLMHGFVSLELVGGFGIPIDTDQSFQFLVDMLVAGLQNQAVDKP